jgi:hypothetical protein
MDRGNGANRGRLSIRIAALCCAIVGVVMLPAGANAATAGNGIYNIFVQDSGSSLGRFTATTGPSHPQGPDLNVIFPCCTSFDSVRSFTSGTTYTPGGNGGSTDISSFGSVTPTSSTGIRTTYTVPGPDAMTIVQDTDVVGTTFEDSRVVRQTSITNNGGGPLSLGIRYLWDYEIGSDDGPTFQPLNPDGPVLENEADFAPPGFDVYRIVDNGVNPSPPTFAVLGTVNGPATLSPQPTPPTLLKYASWPGSVGTSFDYNTSGQNVSGAPAGAGDSAVLYWWGHDAGSALTIGSGQTVSVNAQLILTTPTGSFPAPPPQAGGSTASGLTFEITGKKKQKPVGPQVAPANHKAKNNPGKILSVRVTCQNSPCTVDLKGNATASGEKVKFKGPQISLQSGETKKVRLSASGKQPLAALKGALKAGANGKAKVHGTATAPNGETVSDDFNVKLRGR